MQDKKKKKKKQEDGTTNLVQGMKNIYEAAASRGLLGTKAKVTTNAKKKKK